MDLAEWIPLIDYNRNLGVQLGNTSKVSSKNSTAKTEKEMNEIGIKWLDEHVPNWKVRFNLSNVKSRPSIFGTVYIEQGFKSSRQSKPYIAFRVGSLDKGDFIHDKIEISLDVIGNSKLAAEDFLPSVAQALCIPSSTGVYEKGFTSRFFGF